MVSFSLSRLSAFLSSTCNDCDARFQEGLVYKRQLHARTATMVVERAGSKTVKD